MKISIKNEHTNTNQGFTLIELLIVMVIIAIASGIIILSTGNFYLSDKRIDIFAKQFTSLIQLARNQAIFGMAVIGLQLSENQINFVQLDDSHGIVWDPMGAKDAFWATHKIPDDLVVRLDINRNDQKMFGSQQASPQIIIFPDGELTPFTISISERNRSKTYTIIGTYSGQIQLKKWE